ncbi:unnamed protein product [Prunus brigantina]
MSYTRRCLERQESEIEERRRKQAKEEMEEEEDDDQVVMAVGMLHLSSQGCHHGSQVGRGPNMDRCRHSRGKNLFEDYFILNSLIRDGRYNNRMIDCYTEIQSSYVHERRQVDLIEHLWALRGNDGLSF